MSATLFSDVSTDASGARFSPCGTYRYELWRTWDAGQPPLCWLMLNPSTADAVDNDPTVERCERRARAWGHGGIIVVNLFAIRATDPRVMLKAADPVGPENDAAILTAAGRSGMVIAAWGSHGGHRGRSGQVRKLFGDIGLPLYCLKVGKTGEPQHPLYLSYDLTPVLLESRPCRP
jgi:hypothetical protein